MRTVIRHARSIVIAALFAGTLVGCNESGGTIELGLTSSGQSVAIASPSVDAGGTVDTDAAPPGPRLILTVERVDVHIAGDDDPPPPPGNPPPPDPDEGGWITVFSGVAQVDLLEAGSVEAFLGSAPVPAGKVTQIRLVLAEAVWRDGAVTTPVTCPSCTKSGLKIVTMGKVIVPNGGTLHVTLDFDRDHSIENGKDGIRLKPVIKVARADVR